MARSDTKPGVPNVTIPVIAPPGGSSDIGPINLGGLLPAATGTNGFTDAKSAQDAFSRLAVSSPALLAQIQAQLYYGGFYGSTYTPTPGLLHPEDVAAFTSALKTLATITDDQGKPATDLKSYLGNLAAVGQQLGQGAATRRQVNVIQHPNPAAVRAAVDQAYVSVLGRKATDAERTAFGRAFDAEVVRAQTLPDEAALAAQQQPGLPEPTGIERAVGSPVRPASGGFASARERQADLNDALAVPDEGSFKILGPQITSGTMPATADPGTPGNTITNEPFITSGTLPPGESPRLMPGDTAGVEVFLRTISGTESGGNAKAQNPKASASGLFGYTDGTWNHYGGYLHARDAPADVQWAKARQDVTNKLLAYKGDWRKVAMSWYLPAAVNNPALANTVPARYAGNKVTPNQYADIILRRMGALSATPGTGTGGPPAPTPGDFAIPSGQDALSPLRVDVTAPDLGAESVEAARRANPVEAGGHDVALAFDGLLRLLGGG